MCSGLNSEVLTYSQPLQSPNQQPCGRSCGGWTPHARKGLVTALLIALRLVARAARDCMQTQRAWRAMRQGFGARAEAA